MKLKPLRVGSVGALTVPFSTKVPLPTALPPFELKVTAYVITSRGVTALEAELGAEVPIAFVAVAVNV